MRFRFKLKRLAGVALMGLLLTALLSACNSQTPNILDPKGPVASRESGIAWFIFALAAFIFVVVIGALLYNIIRFRNRPGAPDARQIHGNTSIEIAWTVIPSVVLFVVLVITVVNLFALAQPSAPNTLTIKVIGHQWWWEFQYPDQHIVTADEMHVPAGTVVHLDLSSDNVIHSVWIPQLTGKTDDIPGHNNTMWFKADTAGKYRGECTEFCGTQHAHMDFMVFADSPSAYNTWVQQQQTNALQPTAGSQAAAGLKVFNNAGCTGCHAINGTTSNSPGIVRIGPNLTHFGSRYLIAGGVLDNNTQNLTQWVHHAQDVKSGSDMPSFDGTSSGYTALSPTQVSDLVAYLQSLK